jgi:hypothetical protein
MAPMALNPKVTIQEPPFKPGAFCPIEEHWNNFHRQQEDNRKAALMEQCEQQAKKNIEAEKRKQANSNKKETPEQYTARTELQAQKVVKKETPAEYKARTERQAQKIVKKETPAEYKAITELQAQKAVKKETPAEYKARTERQAQKVVKKETPAEYKARKELQSQKIVKK